MITSLPIRPPALRVPLYKQPPPHSTAFSSSSLKTYSTTTATAKSANMSTRPAETHGYRMNHTMLRVKDPKPSLHFYQEILGMDLIATSKNKDFDLYFLAYDHSNGKLSQEEKVAQRFVREGIVELTHNHGTESDPSFTGYHSGNKDPRGFGHIAITVPDVNAACERFEKLGVQFQKKLTDGRMRHIAFILDPDGYWVEILPNTFNTES